MICFQHFLFQSTKREASPHDRIKLTKFWLDYDLNFLTPNMTESLHLQAITFEHDRKNNKNG